MPNYVVPPERRSKPCRYRNLTEVEKNVICNGCGAKGGWFKPPNYCFTASCNHHDFNWWLGGNRDDLDKSNRAFFKSMLQDAIWRHTGTQGGALVAWRYAGNDGRVEHFVKRPWWRRVWYKGAAWRYYWAVTARQSKLVVGLVGKGTFNFHAPEKQDQQWSRLEKLMTARGFDVEANFDKEDWE